MQQVKFHVTEMQCGSCETIIETAVTPIEGVDQIAADQIAADYPSGTVDVCFDEGKTTYCYF